MLALYRMRICQAIIDGTWLKIHIRLLSMYSIIIRLISRERTENCHTFVTLSHGSYPACPVKRAQAVKHNLYTASYFQILPILTYSWICWLYSSAINLESIGMSCLHWVSFNWCSYFGSLDAIRALYKQVIRVKDRDNTPMVLVGNKCDLPPHSRAVGAAMRSYFQIRDMKYLLS